MDRLSWADEMTALRSRRSWHRPLHPASLTVLAQCSYHATYRLDRHRAHLSSRRLRNPGYRGPSRAFRLISARTSRAPARRRRRRASPTPPPRVSEGAQPGRERSGDQPADPGARVPAAGRRNPGGAGRHGPAAGRPARAGGSLHGRRGRWCPGGGEPAGRGDRGRGAISRGQR